MLTDPYSLSPAIKNAFLDLPQEPLQEVLHSLLRQWHFILADSPPVAGLHVTATASQGLALQTPAGLSTTLAFPLRVEELWIAVEAPFYPFPRAHIRLEMDWPIHLRVRGGIEKTRLSSLSDRGMRFYFSRELVPEEDLEVEVELDDVVLRLQGVVIYAQSRAGRWEAGAIFEHVTPAERYRIRNFIVRTLMGRVRTEVGEDCFRKAGDFFFFPPPLTSA